MSLCVCTVVYLFIFKQVNILVFNSGQVSLFFTDSPTNLFLKCVCIDGALVLMVPVSPTGFIEAVLQLCHNNGAIVCIDGTLVTPLDQKPLALGADLVLYSAQTLARGSDVSCNALLTLESNNLVFCGIKLRLFMAN